MKKYKWMCLTGVIVASLLLGGCASNKYDTYPRSSAGVSHTVDAGTVVNVKHVKIDGQRSNVGYTGGAIVGGAVGRTAGSGDGTILASAGGAVLGGIVGGMVEEKLTEKIAQEITVEMDDGGVLVIVQERGNVGFIEGDRVQILQARTGGSHVKHLNYGS